MNSTILEQKNNSVSTKAIYLQFSGSVHQPTNRVNTSNLQPNVSQQIQRTRQIGMVSENDTSPSPASLRAKILRCFAKKYILLCLLCGGLCLTLGVLYLVIFFLLTRYTTSLHYFQTLPTYIPAVVVSNNGIRNGSRTLTFEETETLPLKECNGQDCQRYVKINEVRIQVIYLTLRNQLYSTLIYRRCISNAITDL